MKMLGQFALEQDNSIVIGSQVMPKMAPDYFTPDEVDELQREIVRRWNSHNDLVTMLKALTAYAAQYTPDGCNPDEGRVLDQFNEQGGGA